MFASKSCRFSHHPLRVPKGWHRDFAACGQRSGLLALNLANIFEKLLDQKTFICLRLILGIPLVYNSARLGHIPSLPWESQLPLKPCVLLQPLDFKGNCDSLRFSPRFWLRFIVQFHLLRKRGLLAHTSAAFLKNCCTEKLFDCLRLVVCSHSLLTNSNSLQQQPVNSKLPGQPFLLVFVQSDSENSEPLSVSEHHKSL